MFDRLYLLAGTAALAVAVLALAPSGAKAADSPSEITVKVPAGAEVWIDGNATRQRGESRRFMSPPLNPEKTYSYEVRARWTGTDGKVMDQKRTVSFKGGAAATVDFTKPEASSGPPDKPKDKTLYERLGGEAAIKAVVDDFTARASADAKVNFTRKGTLAEWKATPENVDLLKKHLVQFVGQATGGPQKYEGKDMKTVHKGMAITEAEFAAAAADLKATLEKLKVPAKEQDELLKIVGSTRKDIVGQ